MRLCIVGWASVCLALAGSAPATAQSLYGQIDLVVYRATTDFGGTKGFNNLFTQAYTVGYQSVLWDPRLGDYLAEVTFLRSNMRTSEQDGDSNNFGFNLGANLFPNRPFPLSITATRATGATSPQFPGLDYGSVGTGGVALPPGYVPDRYSTKLSTFDVNWKLVLPDWPRFYVDYRRDNGSTATGPYEGTEKNRFLTTGFEKDWSRARNQLTYTAYSGKTDISVPLERSQKELLYNFSADMTQKLRASARAGYRDVFSTFTLASAPEVPSIPGQTPPVLSNDITSFYSSGGVNYQSTERLGVDGLVGFERLTFDRNGQNASSDSLYAIGTARYLLLEGLNVTGSVDSALRSEQIGPTTRDGTQNSIGGGASYSPYFGVFRPIVGFFRGVGWTSTLDGQSGNTGTWSGRAGVSVLLNRWLTAGTDYENSKATDDIFSLGNYRRWRWQANAQSNPAERLRLDATWERTNLDQGLGTDRLQSDYRLAQAGATWRLDRTQTVGARFGSWRTQSGPSIVRTAYAIGSYRAYFRSMRVQAEIVRDDVSTETLTAAALDRVLYRLQGFVEYRLRLFIFGFDYRYSNNTQTDLARYTNREWRVRIGRRFGAALNR